jgi:phage internal scaffolding protein
MKYDFQKRNDASAIFFDSKDSKTRQEFASQCNINNIIKKYVKNGNNPFVISQDAKYGDFTNIPSHQDALDLVISAQNHFDQLPAKLRSRFNNDPAELLNFLSDVDNRKEAIELGLVQDLDSASKIKIPPSADDKAPEGGSKP